MVQERNVSFSDRPKYSLNIQNAESLTWLNIRLPAPTASTIRFGLTPDDSTSGPTTPAAVTPATVAEPRQTRISVATAQAEQQRRNLAGWPAARPAGR
jgi:hypothetical protein